MPAQGPNICGAGADGGGHSNAWTNPGNITASDGSNATVAMGAAEASNPLQGSGFGFAIPGGATILGIQMDVKMSASGGTCADSSVILTKADAATSSDKARSNATLWPGAATLISYGSANDLWGLAWTAAEINNAGFTAGISAMQVSGTPTAAVDFIQITVTYSIGNKTTYSSATIGFTGF